MAIFISFLLSIFLPSFRLQLFQTRTVLRIFVLLASHSLEFSSPDSLSQTSSFFRTAPAAYGGSQARGSIGAAAASLPQPQQCGIRVKSMTYTTDHGNTRSLTPWARPGIERASSWILVVFVKHWATVGTPHFTFKCLMKWHCNI